MHPFNDGLKERVMDYENDGEWEPSPLYEWVAIATFLICGSVFAGLTAWWLR